MSDNTNENKGPLTRDEAYEPENLLADLLGEDDESEDSAVQPEAEEQETESDDPVENEADEEEEVEEDDNIESLLGIEPDPTLPEPAKKRVEQQIKGIEKIVKRDYVEPAQQWTNFVAQVNEPSSAVAAITELAKYVKDTKHIYESLAPEDRRVIDGMFGEVSVPAKSEPDLSDNLEFFSDTERVLYEQNKNLQARLAEIERVTEQSKRQSILASERQALYPGLKEVFEKTRGVEITLDDIAKAQELPQWKQDKKKALEFVMLDQILGAKKKATEKVKEKIAAKKPEGVATKQGGGAIFKPDREKSELDIAIEALRG